MLASRISTPKLELGSHAPRWVMIWTVQPPSNDVRARAVSVAEAATIATVATVQAVRSSFIEILRFRTAAHAIGRRHRCSAPNGQLFVVRPIATKLWFRDRSERPRRWPQRWGSARAGGCDKKGRKRARGPSPPKQGTRFVGSDSEKCLDNIAVIRTFLREPLPRRRGDRTRPPMAF
jgi:hypothetical protein